LVADIVGYSAMMEADEEGTALRLAGWRKLIDAEIAKCDGRVFKAMGVSYPELVDRLIRHALARASATPAA